MALSNLAAWNGELHSPDTGTACGATEKPAACGATEKPAACGADDKPDEKPSVLHVLGRDTGHLL